MVEPGDGRWEIGSRLYGPQQSRFARYLERRERERPDPVAHELRRRLLLGLHGRVLEIGCGDGRSFEHYPTSVTRLVAVEPDSSARAVAADRARATSIPPHPSDEVAPAGKSPLAPTAGIAFLGKSVAPSREGVLPRRVEFSDLRFTERRPLVLAQELSREGSGARPHGDAALDGNIQFTAVMWPEYQHAGRA